MTTLPCIWILEDEEKLAALVVDYLKRAGFTVQHFTHVKPFMAAFSTSRPQLMILDVRLPDGDGFAVLKSVRKESQLPVILLTARTQERDRLSGFSSGADDYISKPFSPREVVARVQAVLRRSPQIAALPFTLDTTRHTITFEDQEAALTPNEVNILSTLSRQPGQIFTRSQLLDAIDPTGQSDVSDRVIDSHIKNLRKKLKPISEQAELCAVYGAGYKLQIHASSDH